MRLALLAIAVAALAGCSTMAPPPVGVGTGIHELKRSPCACAVIPMNVPDQFKA